MIMSFNKHLRPGGSAKQTVTAKATTSCTKCHARSARAIEPGRAQTVASCSPPLCSLPASGSRLLPADGGTRKLCPAAACASSCTGASRSSAAGPRVGTLASSRRQAARSSSTRRAAGDVASKIRSAYCGRSISGKYPAGYRTMPGSDETSPLTHFGTQLVLGNLDIVL